MCIIRAAISTAPSPRRSKSFPCMVHRQHCQARKTVRLLLVRGHQITVEHCRQTPSQRRLGPIDHGLRGFRTPESVAGGGLWGLRRMPIVLAAVKEAPDR
jgi:hypothetical protein